MFLGFDFLILPFSGYFFLYKQFINFLKLSNSSNVSFIAYIFHILLRKSFSHVKIIKRIHPCFLLVMCSLLSLSPQAPLPAPEHEATFPLQFEIAVVEDTTFSVYLGPSEYSTHFKTNTIHASNQSTNT